MSDLKHSAMIIVDVQNDFLPQGALAVPYGNEVIKPINELSKKKFKMIIATQDWHPKDHCSFLSQGGLWPEHCVAASKGADFPQTLNTQTITHIIHKGMHQDCDSYSAFFDNNHTHSTGLTNLLKGNDINHVTIVGLALDYCVAATARDATSSGFNTDIILNASRGINVDDSLFSDFQKNGINLIK